MAAVKKHATKPLDVHLMIVEPDKFIPEFAKAGADMIYGALRSMHTST